MTKTKVMRKLKAVGSAQTRKIARRHGAQGDLYGAPYGDLVKLKRAMLDPHCVTFRSRSAESLMMRPRISLNIRSTSPAL